MSRMLSCGPGLMRLLPVEKLPETINVQNQYAETIE